MNIELLGISVLGLFLFGYIIVASIDFGAGFFNAYSVLTNQQNVLSKVIQRYLSPVWEVTNVFLVFFYVGMIGFFPKTAYYYGTTLLVPISIAIALIAIRGSYYAFVTYGGLKSKLFVYLYGLSGLLIPASLSIVLTISEGGFVSIENGFPVLDTHKLFTSSLSWSIVVLSITSVLYISSVFLVWYADKAKDQRASSLMRRYALIWSIPSLVAATGIIVEMRSYNLDHFNRMVDFWWLFAISFLFFLGTLTLLWLKKARGIAFLLVIGQYATAFFAYGFSHYPYLLYPDLTIYNGSTNAAMATALVIAFIAGFCLLIPSFFLLMRLFLFDSKYVTGKRSTNYKEAK